jgi:hypothetical protein
MRRAELKQLRKPMYKVGVIDAGSPFIEGPDGLRLWLVPGSGGILANTFVADINRIIGDLEDEVDDYTVLFDIQHTRTTVADKMWRDAHPGKELVIPDLGDLVTWLIERADKAIDIVNQVDDVLVTNWITAHNNDYRKALCDLVNWNIRIENDPAVSKTAAARQAILKSKDEQIKALSKPKVRRPTR